MNNRKCLSKNEKKKQSFKSRITQRFIFVLFTTHFRIHQLLFTAFFIHERRSLSMNFRKNLTKNSISILNRSKWSTSRVIMRRQACLAWKTQDFSHEERHSQSWMTIVIFTMSSRLECDHAKIASSQMIKSVDTKIKEWSEKIYSKKEFNKKVFFTFNEFIV
jgi:16S rRNA C1402 (ribose-2'-O) methylase RsmI